MSKGLEKLKDIKDDVVAEYIEDYKEHFDIIEKELKALEIIKNRIIDMHDLFVYDTYSSFNQRRTLRGLTPILKEEYNLLKEVLL